MLFTSLSCFGFLAYVEFCKIYAFRSETLSEFVLCAWKILKDILPKLQCLTDTKTNEVYENESINRNIECISGTLLIIYAVLYEDAGEICQLVKRYAQRISETHLAVACLFLEGDFYRLKKITGKNNGLLFFKYSCFENVSCFILNIILICTGKIWRICLYSLLDRRL